MTKAGDARVRTMLFEAAASILGRVRIMSPLKAWGLRIAQRTSMNKAKPGLVQILGGTRQDERVGQCRAHRCDPSCCAWHRARPSHDGTP
ncbi:MAG: hypothetical protein AB8B71_19895 [Paracoccaceae bacterium]